MKQASSSAYLARLRQRQKNKRISREFQQTGIDVAEILGDMRHKALYIKLAKEHNPQALIALAKDVADRQGVKNKGAYFMKVFHEEFKIKNEK